MSAYERFVGVRYLRTRGRQTFISVITLISVSGVALGVAALVVVLAILTGFEETLKQLILGINPHVLVVRVGGISEPSQVLEAARGTPGVVAATPFTYGHVMISTDYGQAGVIVRGIDPESAPAVTQALGELPQGSLADLRPVRGEDLPGIVLGDTLAQRVLGVGIGDRVTVYSSAGTLTPFGIQPQMRAFVVVGLFDSGMDEYDNQLAYVLLEEGRNLVGMKPGQVTGVEAAVVDPLRADDVAELLSGRLGPFPYTVRSWLDTNQSLLAAFRLEKIVYFVVVVLITLVAAFNITSTLIMVVMEKTRDIAILKTLGATSASIRRIFMVEGTIVGVGGTLLGLGLGLLTAFNVTPITRAIESVCNCVILPKGVFYVDEVPSKVIPHEVAIVAVTATAICLAATWFPAWQASKLDPAEALRYE